MRWATRQHVLNRKQEGTPSAITGYGDEAPRFDLGQCRSRNKTRERGHVYSIFVS